MLSGRFNKEAIDASLSLADSNVFVSCYPCSTSRRLARSHPVIVGPSVIPYGVGKEETQRGVVQIPEHFTVGQTVEFIKTIATVDRDFRRAAVPVVASEDKDEHLREQEPGRLHGDARCVGLNSISPWSCKSMTSHVFGGTGPLRSFCS